MQQSGRKKGGRAIFSNRSQCRTSNLGEGVSFCFFFEIQEEGDSYCTLRVG